MTKVNSKSESKSQRQFLNDKDGAGCQWPKLIQRVKANHNAVANDFLEYYVVNDQS